MEKKCAYVIAVVWIMLASFACQRQPLMTKQGFASIEPGMTVQEVEKRYGKPYAIHSRDANSDIYEYIERILMGPETVAQWRYYLVVAQGKVVGKYTKYSSPPAFEQIYSDDPYPNY
ncbi:MAG: hypothetical protein FJZ63_00825 [Chlamydiae bacterium]|nr:hypothetical protein [Chlamydiota bacterium]